MVGTNSYVAKLKAQLDRAIIQRDHWKQLAENRNSILVTEVCPESRSVEEHIIDADSVRASWRLMRGYREQIEALRAENGRLQADRDRANQYANQQALECNTLSSQLEAARGLLLEAAEDIENWGAYARAYFQEKHDLAGCAMKYRMAGTGDQEDGGAEQAAIAAMPLTATLSPEVQASGPYASVAGALAQRYPKPSLLKDCNVSYSNSSRPLAEQGERQETNQDVRGLVSADDVRDACANAVSVFTEVANADQCREVAEYMREVLLAQIARRQAQRQA